MNKYSTVIFDVDGVLLDSLTSHLQICEDKNIEYKLGLSIPDTEEFKFMVQNGVTVSPMRSFFEAVGLKSPYTEQAVEFYNQNFMRDYCPKPFPAVNQMLDRLSEKNFVMGVVTSNVRANIELALGSSMSYFRQDLVFTKDNPAFHSKSNALRLAAAILGIDSKDILYVGDQPSDFEAARNVGAKFLGVTYGWGISTNGNKFPVVNTVLGIADYILEQMDASNKSIKLTQNPLLL